MNKRNLLMTAAGCLALSLAMNYRGLHSFRMDMDSLNACSVFFLGRVDLGLMLRWLASTTAVFSSCEPVTNFCYWLIYGFLKAQGPHGFRWFAIGLQAANSLLVGWIATQWVSQYRWAALSAFLYLIHPMHENWSCMAIPHYLTTFFILGALLLHGEMRKARPVRRAAWIGTAYVLAAFSKETGVLLPLFLLCFDAAAASDKTSRSDYWRRSLAPYLALSAVALLYACVRWELLRAGPPHGGSIDAGRRLWDALQASRYGTILPVAIVVGLILRKHASAPYFARVSFCAAWFTLGILPFLGLLPVRLPDHVQAIDSRYLLLPMAGLAWLAALVSDLCARSRKPLLALIPALLAVAASFPELSRFSSRRQEELTSIEQGLAQCASPVRPNWACAQALISMPLVHVGAPEEFERMARAAEGLWPGTSLDLFARQPFDGSASKWRCLAQAMVGGNDLGTCLRADQAFASGTQKLRERDLPSAAAAFDAAAESWPSFAEAFFQKARALSALHDGAGAAQSYDQALGCPMAYYLLTPLVSRLCPLPRDDSCRFLDRNEVELEIDRFRATRSAWLGQGPPPERAMPSADRLRRWAQAKPGDVDLWLDLAWAASAEGKRAVTLEALSHAQVLATNQEGTPSYKERLARMALLYQGAQDYGAAILLLDRLVKAFPSEARYWNDRAVVRFLAKDDAAALRDLERAVSTDPDFLLAYLTLGGVHMSMGRKDQALRVYETALRRPVKRDEPENIRRMIRTERDKFLSPNP